MDDLAAMAMALPGVTEGTSYGNRARRVDKALLLDSVDPTLVEEPVVDAWLCRAPRRTARAYLEEWDGTSSA